MKKIISTVLCFVMLLGMGVISTTIYAYTDVLNENFGSDSYVVGTSYTAPQLSAINPKLTGDISSFTDEDLTNAIFTVKQTDLGTKYLSIAETIGAKRVMLATDFDDVRSGELVVEMKVRFGRAAYAFVFGNTQYAARGSNNGLIGAGVNVNSTDLYWSKIFQKKGDFGASQDEDGFYDLQVVWSRTSEQDNWTVELFDKLTGTCLSTRSDVDASIIPSEVWFVSEYNQQKTNTIDVARLTVKTKEMPRIIESNLNGALLTSDTFTMKVSKAPQNTEFTAVVSAKDGSSEITTTSSYDAEEKIITMKLNSFLEYDKEYVVKFTGTNIADYEFTTVMPALKISSASVIYSDGTNTYETAPEGEFSARLDVSIENPLGQTRDVVLILATYNQNGTIKNIEEKIVSSSAMAISDYIVIENLTTGTCQKTSFFVWEKTQEGYERIPH